MNRRDQAADLLRSTEESLREIAGSALQNGEYDLAIELAEWARRVSTITAPVREAPTADSSVMSEPRSVARAVRSGPKRRGKRRRGESPAGYPKFYRQGDELVKVGWSKREKEPYVHKAPRRVLDLLTEAVNSAGASRALFSSDAILPLVDPQSKTEIPAYQVYLCLAWLREAGLIEQHGRQGYTVGANGISMQLVGQHWTAMARR